MADRGPAGGFGVTPALDAKEVKARADILRTVGRHTQLKPSTNGEHVGLCPFHDDKNPSFFVNAEKGSYHCFGCDAKGDVIRFVQRIESVDFPEALRRVADDAGMVVPQREGKPQRVNGASASVNGHHNPTDASQRPQASLTPVEPKPASKLIANYNYTDEHGVLLYQVLRYEPKTFRQRRPSPDSSGDWTWSLGDVRRVLYRLPMVLAAETVYVVEGERDADALVGLGLVATTNAGGANQPWQRDWTQVLAGKQVVILPDNDAPGLKRGDAITRELRGAAAEVLLVKVPSPHKDVSDYLLDGNSLDGLESLVATERQRRQREYLDRKGFLTAREIIKTVDGGYNAFMRPPPGRPTGFADLDRLTLGLHDGELVILAARTSAGKTALALNIAENVARAGGTVAVLSYEMSRQALLTRLLCSQAQVDSQRLRKGILNQEERRRINGALNETVDLPLLIDDTKISFKMVAARLTNLREEKGGLGLVVVDYLQLLGGSGAENRNREIGNLAREFKLLAGRLRCPFLVLSQLNRATETRGKPRPQLSDLRDSGEIENHADTVIFIFREELYEPNKQELRGKAELIIAKQRNGPLGNAYLRFDRKWTRFHEPDYDHAEPEGDPA